MQRVLGYGALEVGLAFLPSCIVMGALSLGFAARLIMGVGARRTLIVGLVSATAGALVIGAVAVAVAVLKPERESAKAFISRSGEAARR